MTMIPQSNIPDVISEIPLPSAVSLSIKFTIYKWEQTSKNQLSEYNGNRPQQINDRRTSKDY